MQKFTLEEVYSSTLEYFKEDELAANTWINKYALKDKEGNIYEKTPDDMHKRLAKEFARIEQKYPNPLTEDEIYNLLKDFRYIVPQGSPMHGIGNNFVLTSLSNCFVIGSTIDSYGGIMRADQEQVQLMKRRGGVGHDLSNVRPSGTTANNSVLGENAGMPLYMERFSNSTREVSQDGRRGALMLSVDVKHPDTGKFIDIKLKPGKVTGANISVRVSDEFMEAVKNDWDYIQCFPIDLDSDGAISNGHDFQEYDKLYNLKDGRYAKKIKARKLWIKIVENAHKSAEPGVLFWDIITNESVASCYGEDWEEKSTNPCGEIPLNPYDSCRLLVINLYSYVEKPFTTEARFNYGLFYRHVCIAQRMMDDMNDLELEKINKIIDKIQNDPEPEDIKQVELNVWKKIKQRLIEGRRTGLGVTAEGDMLAALNYRYGTSPATEFSARIHNIIAIYSYKSSIQMAKERGSFPIWSYEKEKKNPFIKRIMEELSSPIINNKEIFDNFYDYGRRNISNLTIAPTGTTSIMTQTTSGIEPVFLPIYKRRRKTDDPKKSVFIDELGDMWEEYIVFHHKFIEWYSISANINDYKKAKFALENTSQDMLNKLVKDSPYYKATSADVDWKEAVKMQGEIQKWVDHSISKTINLPENTSVEIVDELYKTAYKVGCKGVTVYREGSRSGVLISNDKKEDGKEGEIVYKDAPKRPKDLPCDIYIKKSQGKQWTVLVGIMKGKPYEIFAFEQFQQQEFPKEINKGVVKNVTRNHYRLIGQINNKEYVIDNIISLIPVDEQFQTRDLSRDLRFGIPIIHIVTDIEKSSYISSFRRVMGRVLKNYLTSKDKKELCPKCSNVLIFEEGCMHCSSCDYSHCG
jgi:ribonucleoside-diphosphate reductase alpha chain